MIDLSKRANLRGVREERLAGPTAPGTHWGAQLILREDAKDPAFWTFRGEASVVDEPYMVRDQYGEFEETVRAGAFDKTLSENPLVSLVHMHDMATVMAQTRGNGLELDTAPHLSAFARLDKSDYDVQRVAPKMQRGIANSMSFGFRVTGQNWNDDYTVREITEINLHGGDVSIITTGHGANPAAHGSIRGNPDFFSLEECEEIERLQQPIEPDPEEVRRYLERRIALLARRESLTV